MGLMKYSSTKMIIVIMILTGLMVEFWMYLKLKETGFSNSPYTVQNRKRKNKS